MTDPHDQRTLPLPLETPADPMPTPVDTRIPIGPFDI